MPSEGMTRERAFGQYAALQQEYRAWTTQANKVLNVEKENLNCILEHLLKVLNLES